MLQPIPYPPTHTNTQKHKIQIPYNSMVQQKRQSKREKKALELDLI